MPIHHVMEIDGQLLQFGGSLIAIVVLAGLAWALGLGGRPKLASSEQIQQAASEVSDGFVVAEWAADKRGASAIARDAEGRVMVIKRHGNRFAGRILGAAAAVHIGDDGLIVASGERRFGKVVLCLDDPDTWAEAINRLGRADHD